MKKDPLIFLKHIIESIEKIESFSKGISKPKFLKNELVQSAVIRQIEIIGEAVKNLPKEFINNYSHIPWKDIVGTRDKMIHHYFGVDLAFTFDIIRKDLPKLKQEILKIKKDIKKDE